MRMHQNYKNEIYEKYHEKYEEIVFKRFLHF